MVAVMDNPIIQVENLSFAYGESPQKMVLQNLNFTITKGSILGVIGLSGCGKSTLCQILCGLIPHCLSGKITGRVVVAGKDIRQEKLSSLAQTIGLVMQNPDQQLVATTIEDELAFAPENLGLNPAIINEKVGEVLDFLQFQKLRLQNPNYLSGGQKKLVAIGGILTLNPEIIVFDEPLSHLDKAGKKLIQQAMKMLKASGKTLVVVEHDYSMLDFADDLLVMSSGKIVALGKTRQVLANADLLMAENLLP